MTFADAVAYLDALGVDAMKSLAPSTHRIEALCALLDDPQRAVPAIHVTGTNGKTSTVHIAGALLTAAGLSAATYTSPHLQHVRERIRLDGEPISEGDFGDLFDRVLPYVRLTEERVGEPLTYFEILTGMFFLWAAEAAVDAVVVEVGLGGRWDATNVVPAAVAVITNIGLDHTGLLGRDRVTIAKEKAGIIKPDAVVVTAERTPDVLAVIEEEAAAAGATTSTVARDFRVDVNRLAFGGRYLSLATSARSYDGLFLPLHGGHQGINAATALEAVARFIPVHELAGDVVAQGLAAARVPGRVESATHGDAHVILDVAHNPDGMAALVTTLAEAFAFERVIFVLGVLDDKDYRGMLLEMARVECAVVATRARSVRSVDPGDLKVAAEQLGLACEVAVDVAGALDVAAAAAGTAGLVCVTGSHYVVGEARDLLVAGR